MRIKLTEAYFNWLLERVGIHNDPRARAIAENLHSSHFFSYIGHDSNRAHDGMALRRTWNHGETPVRLNNSLGLPSVFEVLVALADRLEYQFEKKSVGEWYAEMVQNLKLTGADTDREKIKIFVHRGYSENGDGGLFPLAHDRHDDLRHVELWYQAMLYLEEKYPEH